MEDNNKSWLVSIIIIVAMIIVIAGSAGFYYLADQNRRLGEAIIAANQQQNDTISQIKAQVDSLKSEETISPAVQSPAISAVVPDGFKSYSNDKLGFSLNIPINVTTNSNKLESVEIIESGNVAYVTYKSNYYYKEFNSRMANQISNEINDVRMTRGIPWAIMVRDINNEQELDKLIKERYGSGCSFGGKTPSGQAGTYDVKIKGDGLDLGKTKCPVNFILHIKYSPTFKKVAIWDIGQAYNFLVKGVTDADSLMSDSFNFIK